eukprot:TRINITY_DN18317_c0_g1_i1.p1 TRINITY_DN18317_c0_g1~~TRINITY_DN18317_c0_g1_i1.p1  ORF type:complete len:1225 (+),score=443.33 TRINITY_DN18317_c0_g1_i1:37-3675(+)
MGSLSPSAAGRGRGLSLARSHSQASMAASVASQGAWQPGRTLLIKEVPGAGGAPPAAHEKPARGKVVEQQGEFILVKPEGVWEATHSEGLYPKQRLVALPPPEAPVEIRHKNPKWNGRYGRVKEYDPNRADGVRVALVATPDQGEERIFFPLGCLKPAPKGVLGTPQLKPGSVPQAPLTPRGQLPPPTPTKVDHVAKMFQSASQGQQAVAREQMQQFLQQLPPAALQLLSVRDPANIHSKLSAYPAGYYLSEGEWAGIVASAKDMPPLQHLEPPESPIRRVSSVMIGEEGVEVSEGMGTPQQAPRPKHDHGSVMTDVSEMTAAPSQKTGSPVPTVRQAPPEVAAEAAAAKKRAEEEATEMRQKYEAEHREKEELQKSLQRSREEREAIESAAKHEKKRKDREERSSLQEKEAGLRKSLAKQEGAKWEGIAAKASQGAEALKAKTKHVAEIQDLLQQIEAVKRDAAEKEKIAKEEAAAAEGKAAAAAAAEAVRVAEAAKAAAVPASSSALWASFKTALSEQGASVKELSHANDEQIMTVFTENLKFSRLDALRLMKLWKEKRGGGGRRRETESDEAGPSEDPSDSMGTEILSRKKRSASKKRAKGGSPGKDKRGGRRSQRSGSEAAADTPTDDISDSANGGDDPSQNLIAKHKGKRVVLNPSSQDYTMVSEVLRHTSTCGDSTFAVRRIVQLLPSQNQISRYDKSRVRLQSGCRQPKVLYYAGPTMPAITEVMQEGFNAELRRHRSLQFSTEANIEEAARNPRGESAMLLLCEVLTGRVVRVPQGSLSSLNRQALKICGPSNPPKGISYQGDSIAMDYAHSTRSFNGSPGQSASLDQIKTSTRYVLTDPDRVVPRYLVYLDVTPPPPELPPSGYALGMQSPVPYQGMITPNASGNQLQLGGGVSVSPQRVPAVAVAPASPLLQHGVDPASQGHHSSFVSLMTLNANIKNKGGGVSSRGASPSQPVLVMCPLHPSEELSLYCVEEEELTCTICASVGRHSGKKCQPLGDLLEGMRSRLVVYEKQVASKLAQTEAGMTQIQKQLEILKDSEDRARLHLRKRSAELMEEAAGRCELLEQVLNSKSADVATRFHGSIRQHADRAGNLRDAHEKIKALVDASHSTVHRAKGSRKPGVSAKAADIIALSKLLEQIQEDPVDDLGALQSYGAMFTEDVQAELARLRLPPPTITSHTLRQPGSQYGSPGLTPTLAASPSRF